MPVVKEIRDTGAILSKHLVCDGKERMFQRGMIACNGFYGCARCMSRGSTKRKRNVHFPMNEDDNTPKTHEHFVNVCDNHPERTTAKEPSVLAWT